LKNAALINERSYFILNGLLLPTYRIMQQFRQIHHCGESKSGVLPNAPFYVLNLIYVTINLTLVLVNQFTQYLTETFLPEFLNTLFDLSGMKFELEHLPMSSTIGRFYRKETHLKTVIGFKIFNPHSYCHLSIVVSFIYVPKRTFN